MTCPTCKMLDQVEHYPFYCLCGKVYSEHPSGDQRAKQCRDKMAGTRLRNLISWFPVPKKSGCASCHRLERKMNAWGPGKCREKMPYILAKLKIAAKRRGLPFSERLVRLLIEKAIDG